MKTKTVRILGVPKSVKGIYGYCQGGEIYGICVTKKQLSKLAEIFNEEYMDKIIPLPVHEQIHFADCTSNHNEMGTTYYWEMNEGDHGWCCSTCGLVLQWSEK